MPNPNDEQPPQPLPPEIRFEIAFTPSTGEVMVYNMPKDRILFYGLLDMAREIRMRMAMEASGLKKESSIVVPPMGLYRA